MLRRGIVVAGFHGSRLLVTRDLTRSLSRGLAASSRRSPPDAESIDVQRARLLYQSKKRGILENDIIIGGFAVDHLSKLSAEELNTYDRIINGDHNEWDLYYYFVGRKEPPAELKDCALFKRMQDYAANSSAVELEPVGDKLGITAGAAAAADSATADDIPKCSKKTLLLTIDAKLCKLIPDFMKKNLALIQELTDVDVELVDKKNGIHLRGMMDLQIHVAKIRLYFRWKSPYNKMELLGTAVYDEGNYMTALYRLTTLKTGLSNRYNPINFITRKKVDTRILEGALDIYLNDKGLIKKIVHRESTFQDVESAKAFSLMKQESEKEFHQRFETEHDPFKALKAANWRNLFKQEPKTADDSSPPKKDA